MQAEGREEHKQVHGANAQPVSVPLSFGMHPKRTRCKKKGIRLFEQHLVIVPPHGQVGKERGSTDCGANLEEKVEKGGVAVLDD